MLTLAINTLNPPEITCAVARDGAVRYTASGLGVKPLLAVYREQPALLKGASVADTVIGKAAAVILVLAGAKEAYGQIMSRAAIDYMDAHGIAHHCGEEVPLILNRTGDGSCPLEASVASLTDPQEAYAALTARIEQLMKGK